jgi:hypothetical protein
MTNRIEKWVTPAFGLVLAVVMAAVELRRSGSAPQAIAVLAIVGGYAVAVFILRSRSETFGLLAGVPVDERWASINQRALASAAVVIAVATVGAFVIVEYSGGDPMPYALMASIFALAYLGSILWFRWRS